MKKLFSAFLIAATVTTASFAQQKDGSSAKFNTETIQLGKVKQGVPASATFVVTNTGKTPLVIANAQASCGCTTPTYAKTPIAPGKTSTIVATYNAASVGNFNKSVTVTFDGIPAPTILTITGEVEAPKTASAPTAGAKQ